VDSATTCNQMNEVKDAIIASATEQFRGLFETNFEAIRKAATESFIDDTEQHDLRAKVAVNVEFDAISEVSRVTVKLGWSARYRDESEAEVDPLQTKLKLDGGAE
jgi:hypothetical protein